MSKLSGYRILVAEDDSALLNILATALRSQGVHVTEASNGQEAFQHFTNKEFDFILSDIQMPFMTGVELLKKVREKDRTIPVVLLITGQAQISEAETLQLGAAGLIRKPFRLADLLPLIERSVVPRTIAG